MSTWSERVTPVAVSSLITLVLVLAVFVLIESAKVQERAEDLRVDACVAEVQRDYQKSLADDAAAVVQAICAGDEPCLYIASLPPGYRISAEKTSFVMADGTEVTLAELIRRIMPPAGASQN